RELAKFLGVDGKGRLGYLLVPKDVGNIGLAEAEWSETQLQDALETAREVARRVRRQEFWPPAVEPPPFSDDFAGICQDRTFGNAEWGMRNAELARSDSHSDSAFRTPHSAFP
ncbi:MAG: hypothetical protein KY475_19345, partial [Planctomycetes bacterium]|nr:hypothetical protein [Planctomycetota bacterium]